MSLKPVAIEIAKAVRNNLGEDFVPGNIDTASRASNRQRQKALNDLRQEAGGGLHGLDKPAMFKMIANMNKLVMKHKQGACAELACMAYMEAARCAKDVPRQIVQIPHRTITDNAHAFVVIGLGVRLTTPTNLAGTYSSAGEVMIIDPWLKYRLSNPLKTYKGWFYPDEHAEIFDPESEGYWGEPPKYDPAKATTLYPPRA